MVIGNRRRIARVLITPTGAPHIATIGATASLIIGNGIAVVIVIVIATANKIPIKAHLLYLLWGEYPYAPHTVHKLPVYHFETTIVI